MTVTTWSRNTPNDRTSSYKGLTVSVSIKTERVMSDIYADVRYAVVWDAASGCPKTIQVSSNFELDYQDGTIEIDATKEVRDAFEAFAHLREATTALQKAEAAIERHQKSAQTSHNEPIKGKQMIVTRSWKLVKKGMTGEVFWTRDSRVGLRTSDRKTETGTWADTIWCNVSQLANVAPFEYTVPPDLAESLVNALITQQEWRERAAYTASTVRSLFPSVTLHVPLLHAQESM